MKKKVLFLALSLCATLIYMKAKATEGEGSKLHTCTQFMPTPDHTNVVCMGEGVSCVVVAECTVN